MRKLIPALALALLALPALGQGRGPSFSFAGDGDVEFTLKHAPHNFISSCEAILPGWSTGERTCDAGHVELGACQAGQEGQTLLAVSTVTCNAARQSSGLCLAAHDGIQIPAPNRCAAVYREWALRSLAPTSRNGRKVQTEMKRKLVTAEPDVPAEDDLASGS